MPASPYQPTTAVESPFQLRRFINRYFWRSRWVGLVVLGVGLALILTAIFRALTPQGVDEAGVLKDQQPLITEFVFDYQAPAVPKELDVYQTLDANYAPSVLAETIAEKLQLAPVPDFQNYWADSSRTAVLNFESNGILTFNQLDETTDETPSSRATIEEIKLAAQSFVDLLEIFPKEQYVLSEPKLARVQDGSILYLESDSSVEANLYEVTLDYKLSGFPFVGSDKLIPPARIWLTLDGNVSRADFYPLPTTVQKLLTQPTRSFPEIENQVSSGETLLLSLDPREPVFEPPALENLDTVTFDTVEIQYRLNPTNGYILPYAVFSGLGVDLEGRQFTVVLATPMISVKK